MEKIGREEAREKKDNIRTENTRWWEWTSWWFDLTLWRQFELVVTIICYKPTLRRKKINKHNIVHIHIFCPSFLPFDSSKICLFPIIFGSSAIFFFFSSMHMFLFSFQTHLQFCIPWHFPSSGNNLNYLHKFTLDPKWMILFFSSGHQILPLHLTALS